MINFITNIPRDKASGGFSARSTGAFAALSRRYDVRYVGPVDPPINLLHKAHSKLLRVSGFPGDYFFFSDQRLKWIAAEVAARCEPAARLDFFHGFTPWVLTPTPRPYIAWSDCTFRDYMTIFHRRSQFREPDLQRVERAEAAWLSRAERVIFRSKWAAARAIADYGLDPSLVGAVTNYGEVEPPDIDRYAGGKQFAFISTDFAAKGGWTVLSALRIVRRTHPDASLVIVGDRPSDLVAEPGVAIAGFLRKEEPAHVARLRSILASARALVHPTRSDVNPAVLVEAAYFGCPAISSRDFAIPEVVSDGRTGLLLDDPLDAGQLAAAMCRLLDNEEEYLAMRAAAWRMSRRDHLKKQFEDELLSQVEGALSTLRTAEHGRSFRGRDGQASVVRPPASTRGDDRLGRVINFVTNIPQNRRSGGFSAMNAAAYEVVSGLGPTRYAGPIDPPASLWGKALSKAQRVSGGQGDYVFFSQRRLQAIAREVAAACDPRARLDFYHGFTPWVLTRPPRPYVAWSDCTFRDYIDTFHRRERFRPEDLQRIERAEAGWLARAERVLFTSDWARDRAVADYGLDPERVATVGIFGEIEMPARDVYRGGEAFVFVSTNFEAKGGPTVLSAFRLLRARHPGASLLIVGDCPPQRVAEPGVELCGFLRKEVPAEAARFHDILARATAIVHPTRSDIAPLLLIEAGYFGCPVISARRFAIPELVEQGRTGILLDEPIGPEAVAQAMASLLDDPERYGQMRRASWAKARKQFSRRRFEERLGGCLAGLLEGEGRRPA